VPTLSIIVPSLNERENLPALVSRVGPVLDVEDGELVVVDDGSTDGSHAELKRTSTSTSSALIGS
jgi:dolichol-phosphate mannosyltransferase